MAVQQFAEGQAVGVRLVETYAGVALVEEALGGHFHAEQFLIQRVEEAGAVIVGVKAVNEQEVLRRAGLLAVHQVGAAGFAGTGFHGSAHVYAAGFGAFASAQAVEQQGQAFFKLYAVLLARFYAPHIGRAVALLYFGYEFGSAALVP